MKKQEFFINTRDGFKLSVILREPKGLPKGVVQINSGGMIPQEMYEDFASFLTENGFVTVSYDYRGTGKSVPVSWSDFDTSLEEWGVSDATEIFDWILRKYPEEKKIVIGHSIGGDIVGFMRNNEKIDQLYFVGSSTKYRRDLSNPYNWLLPVVFVFITLYVPIYYLMGSAKRFFIPAGVALEWRRWCRNPIFFEAEFGKTLKVLYFDKIKVSLKAIYFTDDPYANHVTVPKLLKYYSNAQITIERISPQDMGTKHVGHSGFFQKKFKDSIWVKFLKEMA